jgi:DNA-binding CsgD family transcriptional regulator
VASKLVVSTKTVEFHLANVFAKLGISSRSQLSGVSNQSRLAD